jgi:hypothetical protein
MGAAAAALRRGTHGLKIIALTGGRGRRTICARRSRPASGNYETTEGDMSSTEQQASEFKRTTPEGHGASHWVAEQAPEEMLAALREFLAPYREDGGGLR